MKYLYTLTSTSKDNYYEQFLLSLTSLKLLMPDAYVILLCDTITKDTLTGNRCEYKKMISEVITAEAPSSYSQIEVSRWIKTSIRRLIKGDFLFIDCDTVISGDLSSIYDKKIVFGACLDKHLTLELHEKNNYIINNDKKLAFSSYKSNMHYNSGVIYCSDIPETYKLFDRWHELWQFSKKKKILRDQPAFNMAIYENSSIFTELDGTWNCQIAYNGLPYLSNSKIIHYFATDTAFNESPFLLASENIFKIIKEKGNIPDNVLELLNDPKSAFVAKSQIIAGNALLYVINSDLFKFDVLLRKKIPFFFNILNIICSFFKKIAKIFLIRSGKTNIYN